MIQILPRRAPMAAEAGVLLGLLGACGGFLAMLVTVLVRHPLSVALVGSCLMFGLASARWVSTGQVLPAGIARPGAEASSPRAPMPPPDAA